MNKKNPSSSKYKTYYKLLIFIPIFLIALYLNRTYANFFNTIGQVNLRSPFQSEQLIIWNDKSANMKEILILGDSLSAGVGSNDFTKTYPYLLAEKLATDSSVILTLKATPGAKIDHLNNLTINAPDSPPDLALILIGINDIFARTNPSVYGANLQNLLSKLKNPKTEVVLLTIPYLGEQNSVPFPFNLIYEAQLKRYNQQILNAAKINQIKVIDLYTLSKPNAHDPSIYSADGFHLNEKGYIIWSDLIFTELKK